MTMWRLWRADIGVAPALAGGQKGCNLTFQEDVTRDRKTFYASIPDSDLNDTDNFIDFLDTTYTATLTPNDWS